MAAVLLIQTILDRIRIRPLEKSDPNSVPDPEPALSKFCDIIFQQDSFATK
jgi:hypothetical protein